MPTRVSPMLRTGKVTSELRRLAYALSVFASIVFAGGSMLFVLSGAEYGFWECVYFALVTSASVGFAELPAMEVHPGLRFVTSLMIVTGVGTIAFFQSNLTALLVEGFLGETFRRRRMDQKIAKLSGHFVVAGCGRTGRYIVEELHATRHQFVVVDRDIETLRRLNEELEGELLYIVGDATLDHTLIAARIGTAAGVMAALTDDRDNLFIVLSSRALNPNARIVSKVVEIENDSKILRAGADRTVSPHRMGGMRMVNELVRPRVVSFLDQMLRDDKNLRFEEVELSATSRYVGKTLREIPIRKETQLLVVALHVDSKYVYNPAPDHALTAGTRLIVMGDLPNVEKLRRLLET
ncbi:MAG TPA: TrkA family potassium uptake protein [Polyangiaceae bacterium]|nr:TrkA family potassium uptake protein [Polyangiaceae bacterium]